GKPSHGGEMIQHSSAPPTRPKQIACPFVNAAVIPGRIGRKEKTGRRTGERQWRLQDKPKPMQERSSSKNVSRFPRQTCERAKARALETRAMCNGAAWSLRA